EPSLEAASLRVLEVLRTEDVQPADAGATIALAAAARGSMLRFRTHADGLAPRVALWDERIPSHVFDLPLLATLSGRPVTLLDLEQIPNASHRLILRARERGPIIVEERLDRDRTVVADVASESLITAMVGGAGCVRLDQIPVLAEAE